MATDLDTLAKRLEGINFGVPSIDDRVEQAKEIRDELNEWIEEHERPDSGEGGS